jgi:hypothetical protein
VAALLGGHPLPAGEGGLEERETRQPLGMAQRVGEGRGSAGRVAHEVEALKAGLVGDPPDARHLGRERVVDGRDVGVVELEVLGPGVDVVTQLREQVPVGGTGWHHAAGQQDDLPAPLRHL